MKFSNSLKLQLQNSYAKLIILFGFLLMTGCGGGGDASPGSGTPSTDEPPIVDANEPTFEANVANQPVLEKNIFEIELTEEDGTPLEGLSNIVIEQVSGPAATNLNSDFTVTSTWQAPDFDDDIEEEMVFEIVRTNADDTTETVTIVVDIRGFSGPGQPVALFQSGFEILAGNIGTPAFLGGPLNSALVQAIGSIPQVPGDDMSTRNFLFFGGDNISYRVTDQLESDASFSASSFFEVGTLTFNLQGNAGSGSNFVLLDELEDRFRYFIITGIEAPFTVTEASSFDINNPCYVAERVNTGQDFIWVGQRQQGFSLVRLMPQGEGQFDTEVINTAGGNRSLCHIVTTALSDRISPPFSNNDSFLSDIIAVDFETNELVLYGDIGEDGTYDELEIIPIDTQSNANLSIVDVFSRGSESLEPNYLVILLADDEVDGEHRLVLVAQDPDSREIVQTIYPLGEGIPVALVDGPFIGTPASDNSARDIVVVTENANAYIFEFIDGATTSTPPSYANPISFNIGNGAGSAAVAAISDTPDSFFEAVLLVAYPDTGLVRQFRPLIETSQ